MIQQQLVEYILSIRYWAFFGTIYLIFLTYQDIKNNMNIDDRKNYFMMGITISLFTHIRHGIIYILALGVIVLLLGKFLNKFKVMGEGDVNTIRWIFLGFGIISTVYLIWYFAIFIIITALYMLTKKFLVKNKKPTPFFPAILGTFIITCAMFGLY